MARKIIVTVIGLAMAGSLSGCISLGGGAPPARTYIVVPQGTTATQVPPPQ